MVKDDSSGQMRITAFVNEDIHVLVLVLAMYISIDAWMRVIY